MFFPYVTEFAVWTSSIIHVAHAAAVTAGHRSFLLLLGDLGDEAFRGLQQTCGGRGIGATGQPRGLRHLTGVRQCDI